MRKSIVFGSFVLVLKVLGSQAIADSCPSGRDVLESLGSPAAANDIKDFLWATAYVKVEDVKINENVELSVREKSEAEKTICKYYLGREELLSLTL